MAIVLPTPILLNNQRRYPHRFNYDALGRGRSYPNRGAGAYPCIISIQAGSPVPGVGGYPLFARLVTVPCHINTDLQPTVFQGQIAQRLNLPVINPFLATVPCVIDPHPRWWSRYTLWLGVGPGYLPVDVLFPVEPGNRGWRWQHGFPQWNVLGMQGVLDKTLLCVTAEQVFVIERV